MNVTALEIHLMMNILHCCEYAAHECNCIIMNILHCCECDKVVMWTWETNTIFTGVSRQTPHLAAYFRAGRSSGGGSLGPAGSLRPLCAPSAGIPPAPRPGRVLPRRSIVQQFVVGSLQVCLDPRRRGPSAIPPVPTVREIPWRWAGGAVAAAHLVFLGLGNTCHLENVATKAQGGEDIMTPNTRSYLHCAPHRHCLRRWAIQE